MNDYFQHTTILTEQQIKESLNYYDDNSNSTNDSNSNKSDDADITTSNQDSTSNQNQSKSGYYEDYSNNTNSTNANNDNTTNKTNTNNTNYDESYVDYGVVSHHQPSTPANTNTNTNTTINTNTRTNTNTKQNPLERLRENLVDKSQMLLQRVCELTGIELITTPTRKIHPLRQELLGIAVFLIKMLLPGQNKLR